MKVSIACGGTGGHIIPGMAVAEVMQDRGHTVHLWLSGKAIEQTALSAWTGTTTTAPFQGFQALRSRQAPRVLWSFWKAYQTCQQAMRQERPDVLLAMGSYASLAPVFAARRWRVPIVLHEANAIPGRAIRLMARYATAIALSVEDARRHIRHPRVLVTGMPLRPAAPHAEPDTPLWDHASPDPFTVLMMGGSGGARRLNALATDAMLQLHRDGIPIRVIHLTGPADELSVRQRYEAAGLPHRVFAFSHQMPALYQQASLAICRSGASTCAELSVYGVPALLVPYPHAVHQHQWANAQVLSAAGAAECLDEQHLTAARLAADVARYRLTPNVLETMRQASRARARPDAAQALATLLESVGHGDGGV